MGPLQEKKLRISKDDEVNLFYNDLMHLWKSAAPTGRYTVYLYSIYTNFTQYSQAGTIYYTGTINCTGTLNCAGSKTFQELLSIQEL